MKKLLALSLSLAMALSLAACSSSSSTTTTEAATTTTETTTEAATTETTTEAEEEAVVADDILIGFSCDDMTTDFAAGLSTAILETAAAYGVEVVSTDSRMDATLQTSQVENLIMQGADVILLKPYDDSACSPITTACEEAGVPLIILSTTISSAYDSAILVDQTTAGEWCAEIIIEERGTDVTVCILRGPLAMANATRYYDGLMNIFDANGVEVLDVQTGEYKTDEALIVTEAWLASGLRPDVIIALNDAMGIGASQAVSEAGVDCDIVCTGQGSAEGLNAVSTGLIYSTILTPPAVQGSVGVDVAMQILSGETVDADTYIPMEYVNADNIGDYV